jgi:hypothetical protein
LAYFGRVFADFADRRIGSRALLGLLKNVYRYVRRWQNTLWLAFPRSALTFSIFKLRIRERFPAEGVAFTASLRYPPSRCWG